MSSGDNSVSQKFRELSTDDGEFGRMCRVRMPGSGLAVSGTIHRFTTPLAGKTRYESGLVRLRVSEIQLLAHWTINQNGLS